MTTTDPSIMQTNHGPPQKRPAIENASVPSLGAVTVDSIMAETEKRRMQLEPNDLDESWWLCERMAALNLHGVKTPEDALARIMTGRTIGLPAMQSIEQIHLLWNKTSETWTTVMSVKAKLALVYRRKDVIEYVRMTHSTPTTCTWVAKRRGEGETEQSATFTIQDAETAGLVGRGKDDAAKAQSNYSRHPQVMLQWRACGRLLDRVATDVLLGIATAEEVEDENKLLEQMREVAHEVVDRVEAKKKTLTEKLETAPASASPPPAAAAVNVSTGTGNAGPVAERDWETEAAELKEQIVQALSNPNDKALTEALKVSFKAFKKAAPDPWPKDIQTFYEVMRGTKSKETSPRGQPVATPAAPPAAEAPPAASPATAPATTPAAPAPAAPAVAPAPPGYPCVVCGGTTPRDGSIWVPTANGGVGGWRHAKQPCDQVESPPAPTPAAAPAPPAPAPSTAPACEGCGQPMTGNTCTNCGWVMGERIPD